MSNEAPKEAPKKLRESSPLVIYPSISSGKSKRGQVTRPNKSNEVWYREQITGFVEIMTARVESELNSNLRIMEREYVGDSMASDLTKILSNLSKSFSNLTKQALSVSSTFVGRENSSNKERFDRSVKKTIGINLNSVTSENGISDVLQLSTAENVSLITSIPSDYFKQIEGIVFRGVTTKTPAGGIMAEIMELGHSTKYRAKLIARDQTSKLNSVLNQTRQTNIGVEEYIWRVADRTNRTRQSHLGNANKTFRWDSPPATGHPGHEIQCRCLAEPIFNL